MTDSPSESRDGVTANDNDQLYVIGQQRLSTRSHWRFTDRQFALLQCQRAKWREQADQSHPWRLTRPPLSHL